MNSRFAPVLHRVRLLQVARRRLAATGPHFKIVHRFRQTGSGADCFPGEEVAWVILVWLGREVEVRLSLALRLLFNYLAQKNRGQSAAQIVVGLRGDPFYLQHGANVQGGAKLRRRFSYGAVKEYVKRLRRALQAAFDEAGLKLDPLAILVSEPTEGNEVRYRLKATVEWIHM
ncbi:MAG: hypothetical protein L0338_04645 [Acidobacteria bacterium]|nr:hypothetical protein [Acidobacteriota bacterium]